MKIIAKAIVMDSEGKILVLRRSSTHPLFAYHLDFPGGQAEHMEAGAEAVVREIFEETGLVIDGDILELAHEKRMSERAHYVVYVARLSESEPQIAISWEHDQFEWLSRSDLLARAAPATVDRYYTTVIEHLASDGKTPLTIAWIKIENDADLAGILHPVRQVYVWLITTDNKIILVSKNNRSWQFPGGKPKPEESLLETAIREVREETGLVSSLFADTVQFYGYYIVSGDTDTDPSGAPYSQVRGFVYLNVKSESLQLHSELEDKNQGESETIRFVRAVSIDEAKELIPWLSESKEFQALIQLGIIK